MSSGKWRPFCLGLNVLSNNFARLSIYTKKKTKYVITHPCPASDVVWWYRYLVDNVE